MPSKRTLGSEPTPLTPEQTRRYHLEDALGSAEAMIQDVQRKMTRAAINGWCSKGTLDHMQLMLRDAADRLGRIPTERPNG